MSENEQTENSDTGYRPPTPVTGPHNRVLNNHHPEFWNFFDRLWSDEGIVPHAGPRGLAWYCGTGETNETFDPHGRARAILASMPDVDVERSLSFMRMHGGGCDCEIIWNVPDRFEHERPKSAESST